MPGIATGMRVMLVLIPSLEKLDGWFFNIRITARALPVLMTLVMIWYH